MGKYSTAPVEVLRRCAALIAADADRNGVVRTLWLRPLALLAPCNRSGGVEARAGVGPARAAEPGHWSSHLHARARGLQGAGVARHGGCSCALRAACAYTATASACIGAVRCGAARSRYDLATISPRSRYDLATISHRGISPRPPARSVAEYTRAPPGSTSPSASPLPMAAPGQGEG